MATKNLTIFYKLGDDYRELVSLRDAAKLVGQCARSLRCQMKAGKLNHVLIGRQVFFDRDDLTRGRK